MPKTLQGWLMFAAAVAVVLFAINSVPQLRQITRNA